MWVFILVAFLAGYLSMIQVGVNSILARSLNNQLWAAIFSFIVGLIALAVYQIVYQLLNKNAALKLNLIPEAPWWSWVGGLFGAFFVAGSLIAAPKIGAMTFLGVLILGQVIASTMVDHYGWLGFPVVNVGVMRILGMALVLLGVVIIKKY